MWWKNPELWGLVIQLLVLISIIGLVGVGIIGVING